MKKIILILMIAFYNISYNQIISLDNSFATNGLFSQIENSQVWDNSKIIQNEDGTIYFLKQRTNASLNIEENTLVKLKQNGEIDTNFGTNGLIVVDITSADNGLAIRKQTDGKLIMCGGVINTQIIRVNPNGQLDSGFGVNGKVVLSGYGTNSTLNNNNLILQNDKIIVFTDINSKHIFRLNSDGNLDTSFGSNGNITTNGSHIFLDNLSNIVTLYKTSNNNYSIEKYNSNGGISSSFGTNGVLNVTTNIAFDNIIATYMDSDNNILFSSDSNTNSLFKINADGSFNETYKYDFNDFHVGILSFKQKNNLFYISGTKINSISEEPEAFFISIIDDQGKTNSTFNYFLESNPNLKYIQDIIVNDNNILVSGVYRDGIIGKKIIAKYLTSTLYNSEFQKEKNILIENPVQSNLKISSVEKINYIQIFSIDGKLIKNIKEINTDLSEIRKGIYILKIHFENETYLVQKIIKS